MIKYRLKIDLSITWVRQMIYNLKHKNMPNISYHTLFIEHRRLVRERKGDVRWNVTVDEYRRILRKGCFVCGYGFSKDTQNHFYPHRLNNRDYECNNAVVLCRLCSQMCRSKDPVTLLKQLVHIGSRYMKRANIEYPDSHRNNTSIESYEKFLTYLADEEARITLNEDSYNDLCKSDCEFCGRPNTKNNHNDVRLKLDKAYPDFITTCTSCFALYRCFDSRRKMYGITSHEAFLTHAMMCVERNNLIEKNMKGKILVRNETMYLNHSKHDDSIHYTAGNIRFDNVRNGLWTVHFLSDCKGVFLELRHEDWNSNTRYKTDTTLISRSNQIIDSFLVTSYPLNNNIKYQNQCTSLSSGDDIIDLIETNKFPGQVDLDSKVQIGLRNRNSRINVMIDHDKKTAARIRFYSDPQSTEMCECKSNGCDDCILREIERSNKLEAPLEIIYVIDHRKRVKLASPFIRTIQKYTYSDDIEIDVKKTPNESIAEYEKRVERYIKREKRKLAIETEGGDNFRRKNNEYLKKWRRTKGIKERTKGSKPQESYNKSYKERQIEKYGEETFKKINSLKVKICRLKKKNGAEHQIQELQVELSRLTNV